MILHFLLLLLVHCAQCVEVIVVPKEQSLSVPPLLKGDEVFFVSGIDWKCESGNKLSDVQPVAGENFLVTKLLQCLQGHSPSRCTEGVVGLPNVVFYIVEGNGTFAHTDVGHLSPNLTQSRVVIFVEVPFLCQSLSAPDTISLERITYLNDAFTLRSVFPRVALHLEVSAGTLQFTDERIAEQGSTIDIELPTELMLAALKSLVYIHPADSTIDSVYTLTVGLAEPGKQPLVTTTSRLVWYAPPVTATPTPTATRGRTSTATPSATVTPTATTTALTGIPAAVAAQSAVSCTPLVVLANQPSQCTITLRDAKGTDARAPEEQLATSVSPSSGVAVSGLTAISPTAYTFAVTPFDTAVTVTVRLVGVALPDTPRITITSETVSCGQSPGASQACGIGATLAGGVCQCNCANVVNGQCTTTVSGCSAGTLDNAGQIALGCAGTTTVATLSAAASQVIVGSTNPATPTDLAVTSWQAKTTSTATQLSGVNMQVTTAQFTQPTTVQGDSSSSLTIANAAIDSLVSLRQTAQTGFTAAFQSVSLGSNGALDSRVPTTVSNSLSIASGGQAVLRSTTTMAPGSAVQLAAGSEMVVQGTTQLLGTCSGAGTIAVQGGTLSLEGTGSTTPVARTCGVQATSTATAGRKYRTLASPAQVTGCGAIGAVTLNTGTTLEVDMACAAANPLAIGPSLSVAGATTISVKNAAVSGTAARVTGPLNLNAGVTLNIASYATAPTAGQTITVLTFLSRTGSGVVTLGSLPSVGLIATVHLLSTSLTVTYSAVTVPAGPVTPIAPIAPSAPQQPSAPPSAPQPPPPSPTGSSSGSAVGIAVGVSVGVLLLLVVVAAMVWFVLRGRGASAEPTKPDGYIDDQFEKQPPVTVQFDQLYDVEDPPPTGEPRAPSGTPTAFHPDFYSGSQSPYYDALARAAYVDVTPDPQ